MTNASPDPPVPVPAAPTPDEAFSITTAAQFAKYADLVVGFCVAQAFTYVYILGSSKDGLRESILRAGCIVPAAILVAGAVCIAAVALCKRKEQFFLKRADRHADFISAAAWLCGLRAAAVVIVHLFILVATVLQPDFRCVPSSAATTQPSTLSVSGQLTVTGDLKFNK